MKKRDIEFFDQYKKMDLIIGEMLSCNNGVSEYIRQMEQTAFSLQKKVETWDSDYKTLKHLRWVRNKIAHETNSEIESVSTQKDITSLTEFSKKLSNGKDPLSIIHKRLKIGSKKNKKSGYGIVIASVILVVIIAVVIFLQK